MGDSIITSECKDSLPGAVDSVVLCHGLRCVHELITLGKLKTLSYNQKCDLVNSPHPTPNLEIVEKNQSHKKVFTRSIYRDSINKYLAGCSHLNKLFCWCCVLFAHDWSIWSSTGYSDLVNLEADDAKHADSRNHFKALIAFKNFSKQGTEKPVPSQPALDTTKHDATVKHNNDVFRRLVDVVCYLAEQEYLLESKTTSIHDNFIETLTLLSKYDSVLEKHLNDTAVEAYCSDGILHDIISSIADAMRDAIATEIRDCTFVSVIVDETADAGNREQVNLIFRYFAGNAMCDRFIRHIDVSESRTSDCISAIGDQIDLFDCSTKLIAQCYDGVTAMSHVRDEVQREIYQRSPQAINVWCNVHTLGAVLAKSSNIIPEVRSFFAALSSIVAFFKEIRSAGNDTSCSRIWSQLESSRWEQTCSAVFIVSEQKNKLINILNDVLNQPKQWHGGMLLTAESLLNIISGFNFNFFLNVYFAIFQQANLLHNILQNSDVSFCVKSIARFDDWLRSDLRSQFDNIYEGALANNSPPKNKGKATCAKAECLRILNDIIMNISAEVNYRYSELSNIQFFELLNSHNFDSYSKEFPSDRLASLELQYRNYFYFAVLKTQLQILYSSEVLRDLNVFQMIDFFVSKDLTHAFHELYKLILLYVVAPATGASAEQSFSALKRIHSRLAASNSQEQTRGSDLSLISVEKEFLAQIKRNAKFYDSVMESYTKKERILALE